MIMDPFTCISQDLFEPEHWRVAGVLKNCATLLRQHNIGTFLAAPYPENVDIVAVTSPLGTRDLFFTENPNENVRIPTYFPYRGILVCSLD
jgi:hypothetical protein